MGLKAWAGERTRSGLRDGGVDPMPGLGLAPWFAAVLLSDLLCFPFSLVGIETFRFEPGFTRHFPYRLLHGPYTHSFLGAGLLGVLAGFLWWAARGGFSARGARKSALA